MSQAMTTPMQFLTSIKPASLASLRLAFLVADDEELELGEEPSIEWRLDTGLTVEEPKLEEFEAKARTEVAISKVEYGILVKALSYLLDSGVDVNTLSAGLLTTKNSERNEKWAEDDDPRVDGYEPSEVRMSKERSPCVITVPT